MNIDLLFDKSLSQKTIKRVLDLFDKNDYLAQIINMVYDKDFILTKNDENCFSMKKATSNVILNFKSEYGNLECIDDILFSLKQNKTNGYIYFFRKGMDTTYGTNFPSVNLKLMCTENLSQRICEKDLL